MDILIKVFLPLSLAFIMFSLGMGLTVSDFKRVVQRPAAFCIGALNQVILLPIVIFLIVMAFGISGEIAVGFMILAACPGGVTSNLISRLAKGDVALSVSLTAVISLTSVITVPLLMSFASNHFLGANAPDINIFKTAMTMFLLTVVPISLALLLRKIAPNFVDRFEQGAARIATVLFAVIVVAALATNWSLFVENLAVMGPALVTILVLLIAVGFFVPLVLGRTKREAKTISVETGIQNSTLGIAVAALIVGGDAGFTAYSLPAAVYGIVMYLVVLPVVMLYRRID